MFGKFVDNYVILQFLIVIALLWAAYINHVHMATWVWTTGLVIFVAGFTIMGFAFLELGSNFTSAVKPVEEGHLITTGLYDIVRHPMYFGGILIVFGWSLFWGSMLAIILSIALALVFDIKSKAEEEILAEKYPEYASYKAKVSKKLIPFIY